MKAPRGTPQIGLYRPPIYLTLNLNSFTFQRNFSPHIILRSKGIGLLLTLLNPSSPQTQAIAKLTLLLLVITTVIFLVVAGLVTIASWRFREKPNQGQPAKNFGNTRVEIIWTLIPALILVVVFFFTVKTMHAVDPPEGDREADLIITGHQWWWEIKYPGAGVLTANEVHIPIGEKLLVRLESADVIHDFWVPALARKIDAIPGKPNYLYLEADQPGEYHGVCAEFCGVQHAGMRILIIAETKEEFQTWLKAQRAIPQAPMAELPAQGAEIFASKTCYNCHTISGTGSTRSVGPDLTYVSTRHTLGAGVLQNSRKNLTKWLKNPQQFKPGSHMPNFQLSDMEVSALVAYLESLK